MGFVDQYHNKFQTGGLQHLLAGQISAEVGRERFDNYFRFSFVRNPWDRAVSQFSFMQRRDDLRQFIGMKQDDSFATYLTLIQERGHVQWMRQTDFIYDGDALLVNFVGRFERLEDDARAVFDRLGIQSSCLPHAQRSEHGPYRDYYDGAARRTVSRIYESDIDHFGYTF
jgi:hypothetical protein